MDTRLVIRQDFATKEWMVANGLGGYASGTLAGGCPRRHDGLLVATLDDPWGRTVMLDRLDEILVTNGEQVPLYDCLAEFRLEDGLPVWKFERGGTVVERRLVMPHGQNTTIITWTLRQGGPAALTLRPWMHFRGNDAWLDRPLQSPRRMWAEGDRLSASQGDYPPVRLQLQAKGAATRLDEREVEVFYAVEADRDYPSTGPLWSFGVMTAPLGEGGIILLATAEPWDTALAMTAEEAFAAERGRRERLVARAVPGVRSGAAQLLVMAADAFLFAPRGRPGLKARAHADGDEVLSVIAGYPWFNDWGRDTMISLEGLCLVTGRADAARSILRTFGKYVKDGLIPDNVPDGRTEGVYHAADATLWFFHAFDRYMEATGDRETLALLLPKLEEIVEAHRRGTRFNIGVDPADGLLKEGAEGFMLTWMDSATPRRGKPVEINALWYNALKVMERWLGEAGRAAAAKQCATEAARARDSFNRRFWNPATGFLFDLVDGEEGCDPACRCNQIFAVSLPNPVLDESHWPAVVAAVEDKLLTPFGLRSLDQGAPDYRPQYAGDLGSRDFAYHRGTVWAWLIGPFVDAWLRVHPDDKAGARAFLDGLVGHLSDYMVGTIAEVFDGDAPHTPRGCTAQAWSVAEALRAWAVTSG
jgi:glycogen debranching enzyme